MSQDDRPSRPFTLDDFREQVVMMKKIGVFSDADFEDLEDPQPEPEPDESSPEDDPGEAEFRRMMAILDAMTPAERGEPSLIDAGARLRIAAEAGVGPEDVAKLLDEFETMARMVATLNRLKIRERVRMILGLDRPPAAERARRRRERDRRRNNARTRSLRVDGARLDPRDRAELLRRWEILARTGRAPRIDATSPWFSAWNRGLRLWDFNLDD